ncbi:MAG TPA: deoxyribodipyrimidine photo-lyase [Candidatus Tumulicola sp.]|jgi:deoxyribodipyrimidine photo-lyase
MLPRRYERSIAWLRRDLRTSDNRALFEAARDSDGVALAFVLDPALLPDGRLGSPLVQAFFTALRALRSELRARGSDLALLEGDPAAELVRFARRAKAEALFYNVDYEPAAISRGERVAAALRAEGLDVYAGLDHVYFGVDEVRQHDGAPYKVFTPYKRRWLDRRAVAPRLPFPSSEALEGRLLPLADVGASRAVPTPEEYGFTSSAAYPVVTQRRAYELLERFTRPGGGIDRYRERRDEPALGGTSKLSPQLRAGTIGIRTCVERAFALLPSSDGDARAGIEAWLGELIWRDFYQMVLRVWPHVASGPFADATDRIAWRRNDAEFAAWCSGLTGYPIVDAAMRQLNVYGWMHNRLRMIVASFLSKDLLIDWRLGERYFERQLADADLAQNNGGWQWSASTGTDAVAYFRIFNPVAQSRRIDREGVFVRRMLPELRGVPAKYVHAPWEMPPLVERASGIVIGRDYPARIVEHDLARVRALRVFSQAKASARG